MNRHFRCRLIYTLSGSTIKIISYEMHELWLGQSI